MAEKAQRRVAEKAQRRVAEEYGWYEEADRTYGSAYPRRIGGFRGI
jgi:hypothetical protein